MDVTPPSLLRRLGIALAGLAVAALTGVACVLSFDDLRALAVSGGARPDLAYLYPAGFDALLVVTLICVLLLRSARVLVRAQAAVVLALLIAAAAAVDVAVALGAAFPAAPTAVGVAVAPWVMLALGLWLWLLLIKHVQAARASVRHADGTDEHDIVPFHPGAEVAATVEAPRPAVAQETPRPAAAQEAPRPAVAAGTDAQETPAPMAAHRPGEEPPPLETAAEAPLETTPVVGPTPAPETPPLAGQVTRWPAQSEQEPASVPRPRQEVEHPEPAFEEPEPTPEEPEPEPTRPVRWGDRVQPKDVLVHPRTDQAERKGADTQPVPVVYAGGPDPGHGAEVADEIETARDRDVREDDDAMEDTAPHPIVEENDVPSEAPSGRLRSTPRPPED